MGANRLEDLPVPENIAEQFVLFINQLLLDAVQRMIGETAPPGFKTLIPQLEPRAYILIVSGLDPLESRINLAYAPQIGPNGEKWVIPDAYHVGGPGVIPEEYTARMLAFFAEGLE